MTITELLQRDETEESDLLKGLIAGVAGGLLASLVMEQFQALWTKAAETIKSANEEGESKPKRGAQKKPTTVKVADTISKSVLGRNVPRAQQKLAGEAVHYAMGAGSAAVYGVVAEVAPVATVGDGLVFGTAVWLLADEVTIPALGLSKPPGKIPFSTHLYALASHLVYGVTTEVVRSAVRKAL